MLAAGRPRLPGWSGREPGDAAATAQVTHEFFQEQIEVSTPPCLTTADLERHLRGARSTCAEAAEAAGVAIAAMPVPVLPHEAGRVTPHPRFQAIRETYGELAAQGLTCGLHVHVQTAGPAEAVGIVDRMQAWLPVLLAVSANSPYCRGVDTGYASWRSRLWEMWPTSGPADTFGSAEEHDAVVDRLVAWGGASDVAMLNFGARRSAVHPTVEVRITDVCTDLADTVLLAALVRALATTAAAEWEAGTPPLPWRAEELRAAGWHAARHGTASSLVDPVERRARPAGDVLASLLSHVDRALTMSGDRGLGDRRTETGRRPRHRRGCPAPGARSLRHAPGGRARPRPTYRRALSGHPRRPRADDGPARRPCACRRTTAAAATCRSGRPRPPGG